MGVHSPQWKAVIFWGCPGHSKALAMFRATIAAAFAASDLSNANNVMQQKGSFSVSGKCK